MEFLLPTQMHQFLKELTQNNNKPWFDEHRERYNQIRKEFVAFTEEVHREMIHIDPTLVHMDPKKSLFRINRDVRFSANKSPYKTHMGAKFSFTGQKKDIAGYGFGISNEGKLYVMAGINKLKTPTLNLLRDNIIEKDSELLSLILNKKFVQNFELSDLGFGKLKTTPNGYPKDFQHPEILQLQAYWAMHWKDLSDFPGETTNEDLIQYIIEKLEITTPFVSTINKLIT